MTKSQLRRYRDLKKELKCLETLISKINEEIYSPQSVELNGMPRGSPGTGNGIDGKIDKKAELLSLYNEKKARLAAELLKIEQAIDTLDPRERTVLRMYYIEGLRWENIGERTYFSWSTIHRIHSNALNKLKDQ